MLLKLSMMMVKSSYIGLSSHGGDTRQSNGCELRTDGGRGSVHSDTLGL